MALTHAISGQVMDVAPLGERLADDKTLALFKSRDLEVLRLVLRAGRSLPPHRVPGEITVHCVEGAIDVTVQGRSHVLHAGQMLYLAGDTMHGVTALEDASALVTIALGR